jgi:MarR family transcriptional regulator, organic hydroperoxide resistance regulator
MIVDVTQTIASTRAARISPDRAVDITNIIIADFRATMTEMKCAASDRIVRLGISMAQLNIMYLLHRSGEMTMSRLAEGLNVSMSNATGLIDRMEERGYIERTGVPEDRRIVVVGLTDAGRQVLDEHDAITDELLRTVLARLEPSQLLGVAKAVSDLRAAIESNAEATNHTHIHANHAHAHAQPQRRD